MKIKHLYYCPFTGLGLYDGFRGKRWLKNRIQIFKQFVVPSLLNQKDQDFVLWISWRWADKNNKVILEFKKYLDLKLNTVFTYHGLCFWDDKYPDAEARIRLLSSIHGSLGDLIDIVGNTDFVYMTIQPSDDLYRENLREELDRVFSDPQIQVTGFIKGYIMDYSRGLVSEYNPATIPPFFTIKFPTFIFIDPLKHAKYTGPYKSHEYIGEKLRFEPINNQRGFIVGCHGENISTFWDHPFKGGPAGKWVLADFGLNEEVLRVKLGIYRKIIKLLPHPIRRKLRYWFAEKLKMPFFK